MTRPPDREEALRLAREAIERIYDPYGRAFATAKQVKLLARALLALAADLEAAERERDELRQAADGMARAPYGEFAEWSKRAQRAERDLATAREALEQAGQDFGLIQAMLSGDSPQMRTARKGQSDARAALRSLDGEEA